MWWDKDTTTAAPTVTQGIYTVRDTTAAPWTVQDITWTTPNTVPTWTTNNGTGWIQNSPPFGKLELRGDDADININGRSLNRVLQALEQRLLLLTPNPELEAEWDQLRELGEQYRRLEKEFEEKSKMWNKLKSE